MGLLTDGCFQLSLSLLCNVCVLWVAAAGFKEAVQCEMVPAVAIGENVTLSCNFTLPLDILQITWQKRKGYSFENIATSSKRHRPKSVGLFQNRVLFTNTSLNASSITLCNVTLQDEGDYKCLFNAFPHGSFSRNTHLTVQAVSEIRTELHVNVINQGILTAICSATGRPAPKITWRPEGVLTAHHPEVGSVHNADGTVTVTNACNFTLERLKSLTCVMDHPDGFKEKIVYQEEDKRQEEEYEGVPVETIILFLLVPILFGLGIMFILLSKRKEERLPAQGSWFTNGTLAQLSRALWCRKPRLQSQVPSVPCTPAREAFLNEDKGKTPQNLRTPLNPAVSYHNEGSTAKSLWKRATPQKQNGVRNCEKVRRATFQDTEKNKEANAHETSLDGIDELEN